jgi:hypothetical protein
MESSGIDTRLIEKTIGTKYKPENKTNFISPTSHQAFEYFEKLYGTKGKMLR